MRWMIHTLAVVLLVMTGLTAGADDREDFFEAKIRPVLVGTCFAATGDRRRPERCESTRLRGCSKVASPGDCAEEPGKEPAYPCDPAEGGFLRCRRRKKKPCGPIR